MQQMMAMLVVIAAASTTESEKSSFSLEIEVPIRSEDIRPGVKLHFVQPLGLRLFDRPLALFGHAAQEDVVGEVLAGFHYAPAAWVSMELGAGLERADWPYRFASYLRLGGDIAEAHIRLELGGGGYWWQGGISAALASWARFGLIWRRFEGFGYRIVLGVPGVPVRAFGNVFLQDPELHATFFHPVAGLEFELCGE